MKAALRNKYADELLDKQWKKMRVSLCKYLFRPNILALALGIFVSSSPSLWIGCHSVIHRVERF